MPISAIAVHPSFDAGEFERAFTAADFDRCRALLRDIEGTDVRLASARLALRERRYVDVIGVLRDLPTTSSETRLAGDLLVGAARALTRDYTGGLRLIERVLGAVSPPDSRYYEAIHYKALIAWMRQENDGAETGAVIELGSPDPNDRARARILLSWIAVRRGEILRQVDELQKALDELEAADAPDQYHRANALFNLAVLCRELPLSEVADRVRAIYDALPWTSGLRLERFHVTRLLAAIDELNGNELAAFAGFRKATRLAPSEHWSILCLLDRAMLAKNTGEMAFAAEQLQEAHEVAQRLSWNDVVGEERSALLVLADLFAQDDAAMAEQYLARFRTLASGVIPILAYATDPRVRGFQSYSQGVAWLHIGDVDEGKAALAEAWSIFDEFNYEWRAALCAVALFEVTHDRRWIQRAESKIEPWPNSWIARRVAAVATLSVTSLDRITPAKRQVLELVRAGRRNSEIASALGRSPNTVRNQLSELFQTFNVKTRAELVAALSKPIAGLSPLYRKR
jgi:DNA-binding CsgD family transcriptional regulator